MDSKGLSLHIDSGLGSLLIGVYSSGVEGGGERWRQSERGAEQAKNQGERGRGRRRRGGIECLGCGLV